MRSDQSSLSFRVGHCHRQLIGMNMYITKFRELSKNRYIIHMLHQKRKKIDYHAPILVPRGRAPFSQHQESLPLAGSNSSNTGSPRFTDLLSLCACSESGLTNLIGSGLILLCLKSQSEPEFHWAYPCRGRDPLLLDNYFKSTFSL